VKATSAWQNKKETHDAEVEGCENDVEAIAELRKQVEDKQSKHSEAKQTCADMQAAAVAAGEAAEEMQRKFLAGELSADGDQNSGSLRDQLEHAKSHATNSDTSARQLETKIKHLRKEKEAKQKEQGKGQKEHAKMVSEQQKLQKELNAITIELHELDYQDAMEQDLLASKTKEEQAVAELQERVDDISSQLSRIQFEYKDPVKNFDRTKVKGLVAELLELRDPGTATALEVVAGGALYSVVVDTEQTGKLLLKNGKLKRRVTIIPLNKIDTRGVIADAKLKAAVATAGKGNVSTALSLVGYEAEVEAAMKYVFGRSFVCKDSKSAREVTFHKDIKTKCVTVDGDVFQPSGTLSGGSRSKSSSVLERLQALCAAQKQLDIHKCAISNIYVHLRALKST
jgi:structural maintenance of chromosome 2